MGQSAHPSFGIVQENGHTAAQAHRYQHVVGYSGPKFRNPYHELPAVHAARR